MDSNHFQLAERLFHEALTLAPGEREAFIAAASNGDADLARRVKRMIDYAARESVTGNLLADHVAEKAAASEDDPNLDPLRGVTIGRYQIIERIGEGGFGSVYRAQQHQPVQREVAMKILKSGMDSRRVIARFDAERQTLAMMEHPNIARVFDAGQTDPAMGSRPFFVMELVGGEPITDYCDKRGLDARRRLELFMTVCSAVQHAHQKGVIHRDLKPSNILVSAIDDAASPKVIDFGIAKAIHASGEGPLVTQRMELLGTPQYMSPEQADSGGAGGGIDTRSDIYSLGVVLYELLTGGTPLDDETLSATAPSQIPSLIRERTPERPSVRITRSGEAGFDIARNQNTEIATLKRRLRGDLDWITLKALEADRERRYSSAAALADDIRRHLEHLPVDAGPPSARYRIGKFVRRNRVGVIAASLIGLALIGGAVGTTVGMLRARDSAAQAGSVNDFMRDVLTSVVPDRGGADVRLMEVLRHASSTASQRFEGHPALEAQVRLMLGEVYMNLSMWPEAVEENTRSADLSERTYGPDHGLTLTCRVAQAQAYGNAGRWRDASRILADATVHADRTLGADHVVSIDITRSMGMAAVMLGDVDEGLAALRALQARAGRLGVNDQLQLSILNSLVRALQFKVRQFGLSAAEREEFQKLAAELAERSAARFGLDGRSTLIARLAHARSMWWRGDFAGAAEACRGILQITTERFGPCHHIRLDAGAVLSHAIYRMGMRQEAATLALQNVECEKSGTDVISMLSATFEALPLLEQGGRAAEGEALVNEIIASLRSMGGGHGAIMLTAEAYLASFVSRQGRMDEADALFATLVARRAETQDDSLAAARLESQYADHLTRRGRFEEAERGLLRAVELTGNGRYGTWDTVPDEIAAAFVALYDAWGKPEQAAEYRRIQQQAMAEPPFA